MKKNLINIAASVHTRLLVGAHQRNEDFNLTLKRYLAERFLYRLGESRHRNQLVLKGAMLFTLWGRSAYRATRDLDLTGYMRDDPGLLVDLFREICEIPSPTDGLKFLPESINTEPIRDQNEYHGFRMHVFAELGKAKLDLQIDVGFGNAIEPPARDEEFPVLLEGPAPRIRAYPQEAVVAEKLHAMVVLGKRNSRFKDFYDLYVLARQFPFVGDRLKGAVAATFKRRKTSIDAILPMALTPGFYADTARAKQWHGYHARNVLPGAPQDFGAVGEMLLAFLSPVWNALATGNDAPSTWNPGGPWK